MSTDQQPLTIDEMYHMSQRKAEEQKEEAKRTQEKKAYPNNRQGRRQALKDQRKK